MTTATPFPAVRTPPTTDRPAVGSGVRVDWLLLGVVVLFAALLRLIDLDAYGWVPDHYERLEDARRIVAGELPSSRVYPQGSALIFALPVAIHDSLVTPQVVTALFGVALVPLAYWSGLKLMGDKVAALILSVIVAFDPLQIWASRTGFIDIIVAFLIVALIFAVPSMRGRGVKTFIAYGLVVGILVLIRPTNAIVIIPLIFYWLMISGTGLNLDAIRRALLTQPIMAATAAIVLLVGLAIVTGDWLFGGYSSDMLTLQHVPENIVKTFRASFRGPIGAALIAPIMLVGAVRLWRQDAPLVTTIVVFCVLWALVHTPFSFFNDRYMLPIIFFVFMMASLGWASLLRKQTPRLLTLKRAYGFYTVLSLTLTFGLTGVLEARSWSGEAAISDAGMAAQIRPVLQDLEEGSLIVSAVTEALERDNTNLEYLDLFGLASKERDKAAGAVVATGQVNAALSACTPVYYLQSRYEQPAQLYGGIWDGFRTYFLAFQRQFLMTREWSSARHPENAPWILYRVSPRDTASACG